MLRAFAGIRAYSWQRVSPNQSLGLAALVRCEDVLLCHYFDFMYGTSTGSVIATTFGRLRMNVLEALEAYEKFAGDIFGQPRIPGVTDYSPLPLSEAVKQTSLLYCKLHGCTCQVVEHTCEGDDYFLMRRRSKAF